MVVRASSSSGGSVERLWELSSDVERWGERLPTVTSVRALQEGPTVVGSRFEVRQPRLPKAVWEVTEWAPGRSFTWVSRGPGVLATAVHAVRSEGERAVLDLSLEWTGPLGGLMTRLLATKAQPMVETEAETFARMAEQG